MTVAKRVCEKARNEWTSIDEWKERLAAVSLRNIQRAGRESGLLYTLLQAVHGSYSVPGGLVSMDYARSSSNILFDTGWVCRNLMSPRSLSESALVTISRASHRECRTTTFAGSESMVNKVDQARTSTCKPWAGHLEIDVVNFGQESGGLLICPSKSPGRQKRSRLA